MKRIARLSCEGGTAVARRRSAMSQAARAGSQVAQWTTPSRARQNVIPSQRQHGLKSFTAVFVMAFPLALCHRLLADITAAEPLVMRSH
jgi:hypothetical protein